MRIGITNTVACNGGDAAILQGCIQTIREAVGEQTEIFARDSQPAIAAKYFTSVPFSPILSHVSTVSSYRGNLGKRLSSTLLRWKYYRLKFALRSPRATVVLTAAEKRSIKELADCDGVISAGGTYLTQNYDIRPRLLEFEAAKRLRKPLILFTQSIGPLEKLRSSKKRELKSHFDYAAAILVRDDESIRELSKMGVESRKIYQCADAAFLLENISSSLSPREGLLISVRNWDYGSANNLTELIRVASEIAVRKHGLAITFASTCQGIPEYHYDDSAEAEKIVHSLPEDVRQNVSIDRAHRSPHEFIAYAAKFKAAICTRMHAAIMSLCAHTPVLPIAYERKTTSLFTALNQADLVTSISDRDATAFSARVRRFLSELPAMQEIQGSGLKSMRENAATAVDIVRAAL